MITTELYNGQGLGNQLFCYVTTRVIALDKGYDFGIMNPEKFKGMEFLDLNFGKVIKGGGGPEGGPPESLPDGISYYYYEQKTIHPETGADIRLYDKNLVNVADCTKIDGLMQGERYFYHRKNLIKKWLNIKKQYDCFDYSRDNLCVINFRGGEYVGNNDLYLNENYWNNAIQNMKRNRMDMEFVVITDDIKAAKKYFPKLPVYHFSIGKDFSIIRNAKNLIISNSSFAWFPAWLNNTCRICIAPKYWARHNVSDGYWSCGYNLTSGWLYQDKNGLLNNYKECMSEFTKYLNSHKSYYSNVGLSTSHPEYVKRMVIDAKNLSTERKNYFSGKKVSTKEIKKVISTLPYDPDVNWGPSRLTLVPWCALEHLHKCIRDTVQKKIPGDFIETGAWRGGVCILAKAIYRDLNSNRTVFVADSFQGLPKPNPKKYPADNNDKHYLDKNLSVSLKEVKNNFKIFGLLDKKVIFLKGWFKDTMPNAPIQKLSILRLDGDMYESTIDVLKFLYPKLSIGGYCIIDDYFHSGCRKAVEDYRSKNNIKDPILKAGSDPRSEVHYWIKGEKYRNSDWISRIRKLNNINKYVAAYIKNRL